MELLSRFELLTYPYQGCALPTELQERNNFAQTVNLERVAGIEPASSAWKAEVLPLNYTRRAYCLRSNMVEGEGFEPSKS